MEERENPLVVVPMVVLWKEAGLASLVIDHLRLQLVGRKKAIKQDERGLNRAQNP